MAGNRFIGMPTRFSAACLILPSCPNVPLQPASSLKQLPAFVSIYHAVMARVQTQAGRISIVLFSDTQPTCHPFGNQ